MLKTHVDGAVWLVHQPDHARVSGYLAAHWGGSNDFARPGQFPGSAHPEAWREEVVLAIAEHDNGWWEWEAKPTIDTADGLPLGLADLAQRAPTDGLNRWRLGVPRLAQRHPYAALLISWHPYWLYAFGFPERVSAADDPFRHALFGWPAEESNLVVDRQATLALLDEMKAMQQNLEARLRGDSTWVGALEPGHLFPHVKLLQLMDALSLLISMNRQEERRLLDVPRREWSDRVTLTWRPVGNHRIVCDPYPFDTDPLEVYLPARVCPKGGQADDGALPLTRLHATALESIRFQVCSAE